MLSVESSINFEKLAQKLTRNSYVTEGETSHTFDIELNHFWKQSIALLAHLIAIIPIWHLKISLEWSIITVSVLLSFVALFHPVDIGVSFEARIYFIQQRLAKFACLQLVAPKIVAIFAKVHLIHCLVLADIDAFALEALPADRFDAQDGHEPLERGQHLHRLLGESYLSYFAPTKAVGAVMGLQRFPREGKNFSRDQIMQILRWLFYQGKKIKQNKSGCKLELKNI